MEKLVCFTPKWKLPCSCIFSLLALALLVCHGAPVDDSGGEFISLVPEGSPDKCGYRSFDPSVFAIDFHTMFKPISVDQWVNATIRLTPAMDIYSGIGKFDFNFWPYEIRAPYCDLDHGEEVCPLKKGVEMSFPFQRFVYSFYLLPGQKLINITALTGDNEVAAHVTVDCTIRPAGRRFPIQDGHH